MKHNPRKTKWTKAYRKSAGKEMQMDSTFEFEKRRNTPVRYNRDLVVKTIQAMKIVDRIKEKRKERFHKMRLAAQRAVRKSMAEKEISKHKDLMEGITVPPKRNTEMIDELVEGVERNKKEKTKVSLVKNKVKKKEAIMSSMDDDVDMD